MGKKGENKVSRRQFLKTAAGVAGAVAIGPALVGATKTPEPIKLGLVNPLEGECATWGIPIARGGEIWADEHNAKGGILCGDGERHMIEYNAYTNVCYFPKEELKAFKKAILEDGKKFMFQTYTPSCRKAVAPLCTQRKVLNISYGAGFLSAKYPYMVGGITGSPTNFAAVAPFVFEENPDAKRVAIMCSDNSYGLAARSYYEAACEVYKDKIEVVYNKTFDPGLNDFFPLLTGVFKSKPDIILEGTIPPSKQVLLLDAGYNLGYDGIWAAESWSMPHILKKVAPEKMEGKVYCGTAVDASVPGFSERANNMYKTYVKRWGGGDWSGWSGITYSALCTLDVGFKAAKSIDPTDVMNALYGMPVVDHPIYGESLWGGKEVYGVNHHLLTNIPMYSVRSGKLTLSGVFHIGSWWDKHKDVVIPVLKKGGQTFV